MNKKNILFCVENLNLGGITKALFSLINQIDKNKYNIFLLVSDYSGEMINYIPKNIEVIKYNLSKSKIVILRKLINLSKYLIWTIKNYHKYDFSICYSTFSYSASKLSLKASTNNSIWIHGDYIKFYKDIGKIKKFFDRVYINKFKKIIFVSESSKINFINLYPNLTKKCFKINNVVNYNEIIEKQKEKILYSKKKITLGYIGRMDENQKNISMLLRVVNRLLKEKFDFDLLMIGDGPNLEEYLSFVKNNKIEKNVKFMGPKTNPYPYYCLIDGMVLTSKCEGNPVSFLEAKICNTPIITTNVSDALIDIKDNFGIVSEINEQSYYKSLKRFLVSGYKIKKKFDFKNYNTKNIEKLYNLFER